MALSQLMGFVLLFWRLLVGCGGTLVLGVRAISVWYAVGGLYMDGVVICFHSAARARRTEGAGGEVDALGVAPRNRMCFVLHVYHSHGCQRWMSRSPVACQTEDFELARCGGDNLCGCAHIRYSKAIVDFRRTTAAATRTYVSLLAMPHTWTWPVEVAALIPFLRSEFRM